LSTAGENKTPYDKWNRSFPNLSCIQRFGCTAFTAIPADRRQKLNCKAKKLIFVGYKTGKGYRLLDNQTDKICISHDVIFVKGDPHISSSVPQPVHREKSSYEVNSEIQLHTLPATEEQASQQ
jgi:hypothetical protein